MPREKNAQYDVEKCQSWIAANIRRIDPNQQKRVEWAAYREERQALLADLELQEAQKKVISVEEVARVFERYISHARALLEELPDRSLIELPKKLKPQIRKRIRERWVESVEDALRAIADAAEEIGADKDQ